LIIRSGRVVLPDAVGPATLHIEDGRIALIDETARLEGSRSSRNYDGDAAVRSAKASAERNIVDYGDLVIMPGLVDTHVHVNEPGRTEWEGFDTATRAAAAGGITTIVDMPLNCIPPTTDVSALEAKRTAARGQCHVDVAFWGGVVPGNASGLDALIDAGVRGFKCFLAPSGVEEFPAVGEADLREAMPILARRNVPLLVHAESTHHLRSPERLALQRTGGIGAAPAAAAERVRGFQPSVYQTYLATRPAEAERAAIEMMIRLSREFGVHVHIVHVACAEGADEIARAKRDGVRVTAETCPHYLTFAAEEIPDGATEFKCAPPIREARHRDLLWAGLCSGALDLIATDHSPALPSMKCPGDFMKAWGGIPSLETSLATVWTHARRPPHPYEIAPTLVRWDETVKFDSVSRWMGGAPAKLAGLDDRKGRIAVGCDADLVVWDPDAEWTVEPSRLQQRHKLTPYAGRTLRGTVHTTFVRGVPVWEGRRLSQAGTGQLL
jgi:allantoinase